MVASGPTAGRPASRCLPFSFGEKGKRKKNSNNDQRTKLFIHWNSRLVDSKIMQKPPKNKLRRERERGEGEAKGNKKKNSAQRYGGAVKSKGWMQHTFIQSLHPLFSVDTTAYPARMLGHCFGHARPSRKDSERERLYTCLYIHISFFLFKVAALRGKAQLLAT